MAAVTTTQMYIMIMSVHGLLTVVWFFIKCASQDFKRETRPLATLQNTHTHAVLRVVIYIGNLYTVSVGERHLCVRGGLSNIKWYE